jgi:A/G-specific adenine glycosylase
MMEVPSSAWKSGDFPDVGDALAESGVSAKIKPRKMEGWVAHSFTHFDFEVEVYLAIAKDLRAGEGRWVALNRLDGEALPSLMRKIIRHGIMDKVRKKERS